MKKCILFLLLVSEFICFGQKDKKTYKLIIPGQSNRPTAILISEPRRGYYKGKDTGQLFIPVLWSNKRGDTVIMGYPDYKNKPLKKGVFTAK